MNNNPVTFIYSGIQGHEDGLGFVQRYDMEYWLDIPTGNVYNLEISRENDSLIFACGNNFFGSGNDWFKSTDGGKNWSEYFLQNGFRFISLSPFDDQIIFATAGSVLYKSTDSGINFSTVDTSHSNLVEFFYDNDSIHIYSVSLSSVKVSDDKGNVFSWSERYSSSNPIFVSVDYSQSGSIYLANGRYIYHSTDYGLTFNEFKVLDRRIVGIYKKPSAGGGSDKLYAATKYDLYEITPDTIITIKHLALDTDLFSWFPLQIGNAWVYNSTFMGDTSAEEYISSREVIDTILYNNDQYFIVENKTYDLAKTIQSSFGDYYRVDSSTGIIYKAFFINDSLTHEELYLDLTTEEGDTFHIDEFHPILFESEEPFNQWGINSTKRNYIGQSTPLYNFSIIKDIGLSYEFWWELVGFEHKLKGAVIDGTIYGDITPLGVDDEKENLPTEFSLSQNFPNPFNPTTNIGFRIAEFGFVSLKVYDVLGREVATLVNEEKQTGVYEVEFNATGLSSGIYFYTLKAGDFNQTKKLILLR
ncbi:MAG: T9SS type A sorting domain-containing protein [Ignavibacteria bacterium]|nr:T9SS type A sorting domain-containing protein [Ignavibacteria bacterium]